VGILNERCLLLLWTLSTPSHEPRVTPQRLEFRAYRHHLLARMPQHPMSWHAHCVCTTIIACVLPFDARSPRQHTCYTAAHSPLKFSYLVSNRLLSFCFTLASPSPPRLGFLSEFRALTDHMLVKGLPAHTHVAAAFSYYQSFVLGFFGNSRRFW
jgi:hypothetical protein